MSIYTIRYRHIKREFFWRPREIEKLRHMMEKMPVLIFRWEIPYSESINVDRGNFFIVKTVGPFIHIAKYISFLFMESRHVRTHSLDRVLLEEHLSRFFLLQTSFYKTTYTNWNERESESVVRFCLKYEKRLGLRMPFIRFAKFLGNPVSHFCEIVSQYFVGCTFLGLASVDLPLWNDWIPYLCFVKLTKAVYVKNGVAHPTLYCHEEKK